MLAPGRDPLSYAGLAGFVETTARRLREIGISDKHRIAAVLPNGPEIATGFLAVSSCAAFAPLNPGYTLKDYEFYLDDLKADALLVQTGSENASIAAAASRGIPVIRLEPDQGAPAGVFRLHNAQVAGKPRNSDGHASLLLHTSGTTSRPKLVPLLERNLCASAAHIANTLHLTSADRCLNIMPLFHIHGLMAALLASFAAGAGVVCTDGVYATQFFDWLEKFQPTWFTAVPTMHQAILSRAATRKDIIRSVRLRFMRSSSASLPPQVLDQMEQAFDAPLLEAYGMTEAAHQMASNPLPPAVRKPGAVGPAAGPEIAVMNEHGELLPQCAVGEVVIRGPNVTPGYEANPAANASAFTGGWFRTGDQGYLDEDGYLHLAGRLKELINRGGEKISPREIDEVVLSHPAVRQALSFAVPHVQLGEEVAIAVELNPGAALSEGDLRRFAAERLPAFKVPKLVRVVDEIPKGPTGKLQRIGLAAKLGVGMLDNFADKAEHVEPRDGIELRIAEIWRGILRVERVGVLNSFDSLGGDSLLMVRAGMEVNRSFGLELGFLRFQEQRTLESMAADVRDGLENPLQAPQMIPIRIEGAGRPVYCVPGHDGVLAGIRRLAASLQGVPVWAFPLAAGTASARLPELGERMADCIERIQPDGPISVVGVCFGGLVAFEAACCLQTRGRHVDLLTMIDTLNPAWRRSKSMPEVAAAFARLGAQRMQQHFQALRNLRTPDKLTYLQSRLEALRETVSDALGAYRAIGDKAPQARHVYRGAQSEYAPMRAFTGRVLLFEMNARRLPALMLGWQGFLSGTTVLEELPFDTKGSLSEQTTPLVAQSLIRESVSVQPRE